MTEKTVFTSYSSYEDAMNQARRAGFVPVGTTSRRQGAQTLYIVFARQGFGQKVSNMGNFTQDKIWG